MYKYHGCKNQIDQTTGKKKKKSDSWFFGPTRSDWWHQNNLINNFKTIKMHNIKN